MLGAAHLGVVQAEKAEQQGEDSYSTQKPRLSLFHFDWIVVMRCLRSCLTFKPCDHRRRKRPAIATVELKFSRNVLLHGGAALRATVLLRRLVNIISQNGQFTSLSFQRCDTRPNPVCSQALVKTICVRV